MVPAVNNIVPKWSKVMYSVVEKTAKMNGQLFGIATGPPAGAVIGPAFQGNFQYAPTDKFHRNLASVCIITALQQASRTPIIRAQVKQAESAIDPSQLCNCQLEWIPTHGDRAIIILMLIRNTQARIKMGLPPVTQIGNPLIIKQSRESGTFGQIPVEGYYMKVIIHPLTVIVTNSTGTAANPQQDIVIQSAETP